MKDNFRLLFNEPVESLESLLDKINAKGSEIDENQVYILFKRYHKAPPYSIDDFVDYARHIWDLTKY